MISKVYDKVRHIIKENRIFFITLIVTTVICFIPFPYYINAPGGVIDVSDKIEMKGKKETSGSLNLAYVSEYRATIPTLLYAMIHPDWDILKKEEVLYENETMEDASFRNHLLLEEANQNAVMVALSRAGKSVVIEDTKLYVTYIDPNANTTLKVQDQLLTFEGKEIRSKSELLNTISTYQAGEQVDFTVKRNGKEVKAKATLYKEDDRTLVGMMVSEQKELDQGDIEFHFRSDESGPSGGFMMTLALYQAISGEDLTHGLKIVGTGTIDENGTVGSIGGVEYKLQGAVKDKADLFFVPAGENYEEAKKVKKEHNYDIKLVKVSSIDQAIAYLKTLS